MNFPHKDLGLATKDADADLVSDLETLIACAVRRQSDSITARAVAAGSDPAAVIRTDVTEDQKEMRIRFFAGESCWQGAKEDGDRIFATGHFRPDLVDGDSAG